MCGGITVLGQMATNSQQSPCLAFAMSGTLDRVLVYVQVTFDFRLSLGMVWRGAPDK